MAKPVRLRRLAAADIESAVDHDSEAADSATARRFVASMERAVQQISRHPHNGSLRLAYELDVPELRAWPLPRFPYIVFYVEQAAEIDVWRVLHTRRDLPASLADGDER